MFDDATTPAFSPEIPQQRTDEFHNEPRPWQDILVEMFGDSPGLPEFGGRYPRTRNTEREPLPDAFRKVILNRDGFRCRFCGDNGRLEVDHIIPWSAGGSDKSTNLRTLCYACNQERSNFRYLNDTPALPVGPDCDRCCPDGKPVGTFLRQVHMWCVGCRRFSATSRPESLV